MAIPIGQHPDRPYRIADADMDPAQADLVRRIRSGPRKDLPVNMEIWLHSPRYAEVVNTFAEYVGQLAPMTRRVKEITILVVAASLGSEFERYWHERIGATLNLTEAQMAAIRAREPARFDDPVEQTAHDLTVALMQRREVDAELHKRGVELLGHAGMAELVGLIGLYTMVAYSLDIYRVPVPDEAA